MKVYKLEIQLYTCSKNTKKKNRQTNKQSDKQDQVWTKTTKLPNIYDKKQRYCLIHKIKNSDLT